MASLGWLRRQAVGWSLPRTAGTLASTLSDMEFVQADPIRAPARAQDLILRQRVRGYRVGDLERQYAALDVDEDRLYAYGFLARRLRPYLYPRRDRRAPDDRFVLTERAANVLEFVPDRGVTHPRDVQAHFGQERATNDWGGTSSATTLELVRLRHYGFLRIADRVAGVRRYEVTPPLGEPLDHLAPVEVDPPARVRFLAPFDPVVWDRRRFAQLWSWEYRFEAYTPARKRVLGYYAMPLLWRDRVGQLRRRRQRRRGGVRRPCAYRGHVCEGVGRGDRTAPIVPHTGIISASATPNEERS